MTLSAIPSLTDIRLFLERRGWTPAGQRGRMDALLPPADLALPADFQIYLPRTGATPGAEAVLGRIFASLTELYDLTDEELQALIITHDAVLAIQLQSKDYRTGSVPFLRFEAVVEKLKKTLLDTAAFVVTDAPTVESVPDEAHAYLSRCRFLQTAVGSYVARVQLPDDAALIEPDLFQQGVPSHDVNATLMQAVAFVSGRVFENDRAIFADETFEQHASVLNVDVLSDIGELLERSGAERVKFSLTSAGEQLDVPSGELSAEKLRRLDTFIDFARQRLAADRSIEVVGRIVELRSRRPDRSRNHVVVAAIVDQREALIAMTLSKQDYSYAVMAHNRNRLVRLKAAVRRMRTQFRVIRLEYLEEIPRGTDSA